MSITLSSDNFNTIITYLTYDDVKNLSQCSKMHHLLVKKYKKKLYRDVCYLYDINELFLEDLIIKVYDSYDILNLIMSDLPQQSIIKTLSTLLRNMISPILEYQYNPEKENEIKNLFTNTGEIFEILKMIKIYFMSHNIDIYYLNKQIIKYFSKIYVLENNIITYCCPQHKSHELQWSNSDLRYICKFHPVDWITLNSKKYVNQSFCFTAITQLEWEYSNIDLYNFLKNLWSVSFDQQEVIILLEPETRDIVINSWFQNACLDNHDSTFKNIIRLLEYFKVNHFKVLYILTICLKYHIYIFKLNIFPFEFNEISKQKIFNILTKILENVQLPEQYSLWVKNTINSFKELIT